MSILMPVPHIALYMWKLGKCEFFKTALALEALLKFCMSFMMGFSIPEKKNKKCHWNFERNYIESVYQLSNL